jgi:hypothetical protein
MQIAMVQDKRGRIGVNQDRAGCDSLGVIRYSELCRTVIALLSALVRFSSAGSRSQLSAAACPMKRTVNNAASGRATGLVPPLYFILIRQPRLGAALHDPACLIPDSPLQRLHFAWIRAMPPM